MSYLLQVFPLTLLAGALGLWIFRKRSARFRIGFFGLILALLTLICWPPVAWIGARSLEAPYLGTVEPRQPAQAIVVLSGHVVGPSKLRPRAELGRDTYRRVRHASWLYLDWLSVPVVASGGSADQGRAIRAEVMRDRLIAEGVPAERILVETRSRSTWENAVYTRELLEAEGIDRIALVTDAVHMRRAQGAFEKQGFEVVPAPCCFRGGQFPWIADTAVPGYRALYTNELVFHEWLGLIWYKLRGRA